MVAGPLNSPDKTAVAAPRPVLVVVFGGLYYEILIQGIGVLHFHLLTGKVLVRLG